MRKERRNEERWDVKYDFEEVGGRRESTKKREEIYREKEEKGEEREEREEREEALD